MTLDIDSVEFNERVRERAYYIWQEAGQPDGQGHRFWEMARQICIDEQVVEPGLRESLSSYDYHAIKDLNLRQARLSYEFYQLEQSLTLGAPGKQANPLWYYTTGDTLIKIISSGEIWTTQATCLNDSFEIRHGLSLMKRVLELRNQSSYGDEEAAFHSYLLEKLSGTPLFNLTCFIACFSENKNDLSQWRGYSGGENGYSLAFDAEAILTAGQYIQRPRLAKVSYDNAYNQIKCRHIIDTLFDFFRIGIPHNPYGFPLDLWVRATYAMFENLALPWVACMKHPDFRSEAEWRLILDVRHQADLKFLQKSTMMTRHLPILFPKLSATHKFVPVKEIMVGPSRHPNISARSVGALLRQYRFTQAELGWDVHVSESGTPYQVL